MDSDDIPKPIFDSDIESCPSGRHQNYRYISPDELAKFLSDPTCHSYDYILIVDARFIYEYKGGKIVGALNVTTLQSMVNLYEKYQNDGQSICIIIHCEYSSVRGPKLYDLFREYDRSVHTSDYPNLSYPNLFLLEGGYKKFYGLHPEFCVGHYVSMYDQEYISNDQIRSCQRNYFFDLKEKYAKNFRDNKSCNDLLNSEVEHNLKLKVKHCSKSEPIFRRETIDDDSTIESQPRTIAYTENDPHKLIQFI